MKTAVGVFLLFACFVVLAVSQDEDGFIRGPGGGLFHPNCHVVLPEGARMVNHDTIELVDGTIEPIPPCNTTATNGTQYAREQKREANGWNTYSRYFMNAYMDAFNGDWVVPNLPAGGYRGQLLYYFTGLEDASCNCILQPVVWYGISPAGGGNAWFAAIWYVYNNNVNYITSPVVQVQPGWYISTSMQRFAGTGWMCYMSANGQSLTSGMFPDNVQSNAYCTLEVYNVVDCNSFPYYTALTFQNLAIAQTGVGYVGLVNSNWNIYVTQTDCGQSMSCDRNTCTMWYGTGYPCPANAGPALGVGGSLNSAGTTTIVSDGCWYRLVMQGDGNLVIYDGFWRPIWYTGTSGVGVGPYVLVMQGDGNLVIYDARGVPIWYTSTSGVGVYPYSLWMQTDGNLVIYDANSTPIWYTGT